MDRSKKEGQIGDILRAALAIAAKRKGLLLRLRQALENNDLAEVIKLAKELCGINEQGCNRTNSRIN